MFIERRHLKKIKTKQKDRVGIPRNTYRSSWLIRQIQCLSLTVPLLMFSLSTWVSITARIGLWEWNRSMTRTFCYVVLAGSTWPRCALFNVCMVFITFRHPVSDFLPWGDYRRCDYVFKKGHSRSASVSVRCCRRIVAKRTSSSGDDVILADRGQRTLDLGTYRSSSYSSNWQWHNQQVWGDQAEQSCKSSDRNCTPYSDFLGSFEDSLEFHHRLREWLHLKVCYNVYCRHC